MRRSVLEVEPVVASISAGFDDGRFDRVVPVGTTRKRLAVGEGLFDRLRVWLIPSEDTPLLRRSVSEVLELNEHRGLGRTNVAQFITPYGILRLFSMPRIIAKPAMRRNYATKSSDWRNLSQYMLVRKGIVLI